MPNLISVILFMVSFVGGMLLSRTMLRKELEGLKGRVTQLVSEAEILRTTLSSKTHEFNEMHAAMSKQYATELEKQRNEHRSLLETHANESREKLRAAEDKSFSDGVRQAELRHSNNGSAFSVQIRPYVVKIKDEGIICDKNFSAIGFQYQMFVNGIPCFQPHVVIEQEYTETEVNDERLKWLTEQAFRAAQLAIQATNAQDMFKFVESPLIAEQKK